MWTSVLLVFTVRISRTLNQTGIKWASQPDVSDWLVAPDNKLIFSVISFTSILIILASQVQRSRLIESFILAIGLTLVYHYRSATGSLTSPWQHHEVITDGLMEARLVYCCSLALVICSILTVCKTLFKAQGEDDSTPFSAYQKTLARALDTFLMGLLVLEALLLRTHNVVLLALFYGVTYHTYMPFFLHSNNPTWRLALLYYWLGQATYFALGNSNSLSTVDIAAGYIGMRAHDGLVALILMSLATYASPVLWLTALIKYQVKNATSYTTMYRACVTMVVPNALLLCVYCTLVYAQRYHLFVWSVFSPKLLYETMRALVMFCAYATVLIFASVIDKHGKISQSKKQ
ncbi:predicted protein [Nematostella vectensis]|uniref:GPI ethanolamine phosphate transferase 2 C-terminal domain-containing protein n=1 Tax=Nematostella vectensis TaxID=45351 RepID=A7RTY1_NEMVE|nr:predicted protein [Nematostella vectensis]|eukprot:XP_001637174.1 predicted protein [Nematostella vectensis]